MNVLRFVVLAGVCQVMGCARPTAAPATPATGSTTVTDSSSTVDADPIAKAMSQLSPEDREKAIAQKDCPVADGPLGTMGVPIKVTIKGRDVFLCCKGCQQELTENPAKYLAKLDAANASPATEPSPTNAGANK